MDLFFLWYQTKKGKPLYTGNPTLQHANMPPSLIGILRTLPTAAEQEVVSHGAVSAGLPRPAASSSSCGKTSTEKPLQLPWLWR